MAWAIFVLVLLCVFIYKFCKTMIQHLRMYKTASSIPGPKEFTLIGVVFKVAGVDAMFDYLMQLTDVFGSPVKFWYGPASLVVLIDTPEDFKTVLNSENCLNKAPFYNFLNTGKALIVADKEMWKAHSRILSKAFNKRLLESSVKVINDEALKLIVKLTAKVDGKEFDVLPLIVDSVLETIFKNFLELQWSETARKNYIEDSKR
jgi:cytochrome P450